MPDWDSVVRKALASQAAKLSHAVLAELTDHLEDLYEELRAQGVGEAEAVARLIDSADWRLLARQIVEAREPRRGVNARTRQLWLPCLASLSAANIILLVVARASLQPQTTVAISESWFPGLSLVSIYLPWLVAQPVVGALGAHLSHRAGGSRAMRVATALSPSIVMLFCWVFVIPISAALENDAWVFNHPVPLVMGALAWVVPAAMALFFGSLPFLGFGNKRAGVRTAG